MVTRTRHPNFGSHNGRLPVCAALAETTAHLTPQPLHELRSCENGGTVKNLSQKALIRAMAAAGTISTLVAIGGAGRKW